MRHLPLPGYDYCDARPNGSIVANAVDGSHVLLNGAAIPLTFGGCLQIRLSPTGLECAGHAHNGNDIMRWTGTTWLDAGYGEGERACIFLPDSSLLTVPGPGLPPGSQGYRYIDGNGHAVESLHTYSPDDPYSDITHALGERDIFEMTVLPSGIRVGQGRTGGAVIRGLNGVLRVLDPTPDCRFVNASEDGDQIAVALMANGQATAYWFTAAEIASLPVPAIPAPTPAPPPSPSPSPLSTPESPPMSIPNLSSLLTTIASKYDLADNSLANCAAIVHEFVETARRDNAEWGYISKIPGETQYEGRSQDSVAYGQASPVSVKLISGAGDPHPITLVWVEGGGLRTTDHWLYPDSASFAAPPVQNPPSPAPIPAPVVPDIPVTPLVDAAAILAAIQANTAKLEQMRQDFISFGKTVQQYAPALLGALAAGGGSLSGLLGSLTKKSS